MKIKIRDKSLMMIFLLEECNLTCAHCVREEEPMDPGYKLSFGQFQLCLSDCRSLEGIRWVHFSGGEPTLWREKDRTLVDLLLEIARAGFTPGFTTNGSFFDDYNRCYDFLATYVDGSTMPLRLYLSIDTFHHNFDRHERRAPSLDNVMKCQQELPGAQAELLDITAMAVVSKDFESLLPNEMIGYYESMGITFSVLPLLPRGKAKSFSHLCPDLNSDNPEDLGAYQQFHQMKNRRKRNEAENHYTANNLILIGGDYYFDDPWRKVAQLGRLPDTIIRAYSGAAGGTC